MGNQYQEIMERVIQFYSNELPLEPEAFGFELVDAVDEQLYAGKPEKYPTKIYRKGFYFNDLNNTEGLKYQFTELAVRCYPPLPIRYERTIPLTYMVSISRHQHDISEVKINGFHLYGNVGLFILLLGLGISCKPYADNKLPPYERKYEGM